MSSIPLLLFTYLKTDAALVGSQTTPPDGVFSGILTGGLWNRPLKRSIPGGVPTPGSTPAAFGGELEGGRIRYAASLVDRGTRDHRQEPWIPTAFDGSLLIYFYAPAHDRGKLAIHQAQERVYDLLHGYRFLTEQGVYARTFFRGTFGVSDSEEYIGAVTDYCFYDIVSRHRSAT